MVIVHFASIDNYPYRGTSVVVPKHIANQERIATVGFVNTNNTEIAGIANQFKYDNGFSIKKLPHPFNNPDIVVFHEAYRIEYLRISKELRKLSIPYIIVPHGELSKEAQKHKWLKKKVANILLFNKFINCSLAIQCLSQRELDNTRFKAKKIVGTNGIEMPEISKEKFCQEGIKFTFIGRLDPYIKGLDLMLKAIVSCSELMRNNNARVFIYGPNNNDWRGELAESVDKLNVSDLVVVNEAVSGDEKKMVLLESDVFMQTSRTEGMPMGILEALSYGLPCIVTKGTTLAEMINDSGSGWGCETSAEAISEAINDAIENKSSLMEKSASAVKFIRENFLWEKIACQTINKYVELLEKY